MSAPSFLELPTAGGSAQIIPVANIKQISDSSGRVEIILFSGGAIHPDVTLAALTKALDAQPVIRAEQRRVA